MKILRNLFENVPCNIKAVKMLQIVFNNVTGPFETKQSNANRKEKINETIKIRGKEGL